MKRLLCFMIWASVLLVSGCAPKENEPVKKDSISLSSTLDIIDYTAQILELTVASSGEWSIGQSDYGWVTPSAMNGRDGDVVEFTVDKNTSGSRRKAEFVFAPDFTSQTSGYRKHLDLDSFLKNFIVGEFAGNTDTYWSVYMYKDISDGKLYTGPVWDYDLAFENDQRTYPINTLNDYIYASRGSVASEAIRSLVTRIVKEDAAAKARLLELWTAACTDGDLDGLVDMVDEMEDLLQESQELNFKRWRILDQRVHENYQALGLYAAEVGTVRNYMTDRLESLDKLIRK